ncbi:MAG: peptide chain release factor 2 [Prevotellaceae bacterium]|nr:peptide chain release factor 2 [Prevotellaceae bacterium]
MVIIENIKELSQRIDALRRHLDIDSKRIEFEEEQQKTQNPCFWDNPKEAEIQLKKVASIKSWLSGFEQASSNFDDLQVLFDFAKSGEASEADVDEQYRLTIDLIEKLELQNMLRNDEDKLGAVLKINSGAGGTESQDWAEMLMRMYLRWCENKGYKTQITNILNGDDAGIKSVTIQVEGDFAYGYLKSENGVHRLVRVSPFNAQGKRMTSFSSVFVSPLVDDSIEVVVNQADISWDTFRSSGAGGQNVNKVETGVRLRYNYRDADTGEVREILIENTESRSQLGNRENAMRLLKSQLYNIELQKRNAEQAKLEAGKKKIEWGSQIRSYVFDDRRVKDHRTNYQTSDVQGVMDGNLDAFIKAYLMEFGGKSSDDN